MIKRTRPGILFRAESPSVVTLPRMDIAAFVGFAASGPLDVPVKIEDVPRFREIFGAAPRLAWDAGARLWQTACLAGAVEDFFAQGGRRCWVVRVAGAAAVNQFPLAGLLQSDGSTTESAVLRARSAGSWSDGLQTAATLLTEGISPSADAVTPAVRLRLQCRALRGAPLQTGDLLQLDFADAAAHRAYLCVEHSTPLDAGGRVFEVEGAAHWFRPMINVGMLNGTARTALPAGHPVMMGTAELDTAALELRLTDNPAYQPGAGEWIRFESPEGAAWLLVEAFVFDHVRLAGAWWEGFAGGDSLPVARALRLTLALLARREESLYTMSDLALCPPHPRFVGYLPDDERLFRLTVGEPQDAAGHPGDSLRVEASHPRFPLAGDESMTYIPLGLRAQPFAWMSRLPLAGSPLERDGLVPSGVNPFTLTAADWSAFMADVHLDPLLRLVGERSLLAEALDRRYVRGEQITGLHSLIPLDEVSIIALPDAAQRGWQQTAGLFVMPKVTPPPAERPESCPGHDLFQPKPDESAEAEPPPAEPLSAPAAAPDTIWQLLSEGDYDTSGLLLIQRKLTELAAARADAVAVLSLPKHFRVREALDYRRDLDAQFLQAGDSTASYAAFYHPWLIVRGEDGVLSHLSPDGAVCGVIAARSIARGAWVPPANEPLRRALALLPVFSDSDEGLLYDDGVNLIQQNARGFLVWGASTLSADPDLLPLNVRRLLIVLRRMALREGQNFVFAPHSPAFRRQVAFGLERQLGVLFERGAFAGADPSGAYRVVVDETVNTQSSIEQGRFIVELRVAPAQPLIFITVRLIQSETDSLVVEEV
jgi:hypothetical protein